MENMENSTNKMKRTTNRAQFSKMVGMMKQHPDIARNLTKLGIEEVQEFWQNLKNELNTLGPPIKETAEWKKVWSDHKSSLKKKLTHNKREFNATGGGKNTQIMFTSLEEDVIELICLRDSVDGVPNTNKFGVPRKRTCTEISSEIPCTSIPHFEFESATLELPLSGLIVDNSELSLQNETPYQAEVPQSKGPKSLKLMEKQINIQKKLCDNIEMFIKSQNDISAEMITNQKKIYRGIDRLADRYNTSNEILQQRLAEEKRHNQRMEHLAVEKNKIKMQLLEIELNKAELNL